MKKEIMIEGMTCGHCKMRVENALKEVVGVNEAEVVLDKKIALVDFAEGTSIEQLTEAVEEAGYRVLSVN